MNEYNKALKDKGIIQSMPGQFAYGKLLWQDEE